MQRPLGDARLLLHGISRAAGNAGDGAKASALSASLELVREGDIELRQSAALRAALRAPPGEGEACRWRRPPMGEPAPPGTGRNVTSISPGGSTGCISGCWRRCSSPRPSRCRERRSRCACPRASTSTELLSELQTAYAGRGVNAAPRRRSLGVPHRGGSRLRAQARSGGAEEALARGASRRSPSIAYHQPATRAEIEEVRGRADLQGHARRAAGDRLDQAARPAAHARPACHFRHDAGLPRPFRPGIDRRPARACRPQGGRADRELPPSTEETPAAGRRAPSSTRTRIRWSWISPALPGARQRRAARGR